MTVVISCWVSKISLSEGCCAGILGNLRASWEILDSRSEMRLRSQAAGVWHIALEPYGYGNPGMGNRATAQPFRWVAKITGNTSGAALFTSTNEMPQIWHAPCRPAGAAQLHGSHPAGRSRATKRLDAEVRARCLGSGERRVSSPRVSAAGALPPFWRLVFTHRRVLDKHDWANGGVPDITKSSGHLLARRLLFMGI